MKAFSAISLPYTLLKTSCNASLIGGLYERKAVLKKIPATKLILFTGYSHSSPKLNIVSKRWMTKQTSPPVVTARLIYSDEGDSEMTVGLYTPIPAAKNSLVKRGFDFCFSFLFLAFTFPIYLVIALAIKLDSPGPVFFKQTRIGLHGQPFKVWKFRTMHTNAEAMQQQLEALNENKDGVMFKMKDDPRITRAGKFLRRYSLDELPQIINVLLDQMSLIGPRPLPTRDVEKFSRHHFARHSVLPGITGYWQVSGRSDIIDFEQVYKLDLHYIENWSLSLDFKILLKTVAVVLNKTGAY